MSEKLPDADDRLRAATDFRTNLVVEAGAGTGKTSLLVERLLNAVGSGVARIEEIAAITFTEKAAGEMRVRLADGLDRLRNLARGSLESDPGHEADRAFSHLAGTLELAPGEIATRALAAMESLDQAKVMTIHGFCSELLRAHPVEAGVDPAFIVDSGEHAKTVRDAGWEAFVSRELGPAAGRADLWRGVLERFGVGPAGELARTMADFTLPAPLLGPPFLEIDARLFFGDDIKQRIDGISSLMERQSGISPVGVRVFSAMLVAFEAMRDEGVEGFRRSVDAGELRGRLKKSWRPGPYKKLSGATNDEVQSVGRDSFALAKALNSVDAEGLSQLLEATAPFVHEFREEYLRRGFIGFNALLTLARDLLRDHLDVRRRLKERFRLLLVDEFQDTDPVQYEIVLFLAEETEGNATRANAARLQTGKLFIVGDPKQSIYRFRGADFEAYNRAVEQVLKRSGAQLELCANFRSVRAILEPINKLFEKEGRSGSWDGDSRYQPGYIPIRAARSSTGQEKPVELWTIDLPPGALAGARRESEAQLIAREIVRWVREEKACRYQDITILFRAFTSIATYLRPLRELGIPFVVDGGRDFLERPEVGYLIATFRTLARPNDEPALLAFLRSPAGGVTDVELEAYAGDRGRWSFRHEADATRFPAIACSFDLLRELEARIRHLPADAAVRCVLKETQQLPLGAAAFEGPQRVANLRKLLAAAGELARDGRLSLEQVVDALEEGLLEDLQADRPLADDSAEAVRITNIHRMKGLENERIFVPDLARGKNPSRRPPAFAGTIETPGKDGKTILAIKAGAESNAAYVWGELQNAHHADAEEIRVLYVALTRAREQLVLIAGESKSTSNWVCALARWGYDPKTPPEDGELLADGDVLHRVPRLDQLHKTHAPPPERNAGDAVALYRKSRERMDAAVRLPVDVPSGLDGRRDELPPASAAPRELAKAVGTTIHRLLEIGPDLPPDAMRERLSSLCRETAETSGVEAKELASRAGEILDGFLASPLAARLRNVRALGRELPILVRRDDGRTFRGTIDLLYEKPEGGIVVADYKTTEETDECALRDRYVRQLATYADAVRLAFGLDHSPATELWMLRSGRRIELGGSPPQS